MSGFFEEVQRRKVYRVAAAYIIAAGFIIQIGSAVFPAWELPNWTFRLVVVLLLIGFPISLILAWAYDVTPQGIRSTPTIAAPGRKARARQCAADRCDKGRTHLGERLRSRPDGRFRNSNRSRPKNHRRAPG